MRRRDGGGGDLRANPDGEEDEEAVPADRITSADQGRHNHADQSERGDTVGGEHLEVEPGVAEEVQPAETLATEPNVLTYNDEKPPEHQEGGCVEPSEAAATDEEEGDHDWRDGDRKHGDALGQLGEGHRRTP